MEPNKSINHLITLNQLLLTVFVWFLHRLPICLISQPRVQKELLRLERTYVPPYSLPSIHMTALTN